ncbi:MAG: tRNA 2-thiouridine(34) synthase MnmA [Bdellovibrionales bacterium]|nr:tRNA 2-thiouridine(34) synthase MnmA [Bdellovibrionales bacterium]
MKKKKVLVAMSGGVDSSVSAALLKDQGYDVVGMTMQVWDYSRSESDVYEGYGTCCSSVDVEDARAVCQKLNIPFYVLNCEARFKAQVIDKFVDSYLKGQTPIPCVDCNTYLKFDHLVQKMKELECDYLATGHYARVVKAENGKHYICKSTDDWKDQTYFLFTLSPKLIPQILFPVGTMDKQKVRQIAEKKGLNVFRKKDSTGLCFVGSGGYADFIKKQLKEENKIKEGPIKFYPSGKVLGQHKGLYQFTYGQRKGLGVSFNRPLYVVKVDTKNNTLWLGEESDLYSKKARLVGLNWLDEIKDGERLKVKIRFHHEGCWTWIYKEEEDNTLRLEFEQAQKAVTPGQAAVLYRGNQLLGGGSIVSFS